LRVEERDRERWHGAMRAEAKDRKLGGGVRARLSMDLLDHGPTETQLRVTLEANVLGKIGEFGQPVMRKKADALLQEFADQVGQRLLERM
jgi:carbon monoxide dehydrogenase subunit G